MGAKRKKRRRHLKNCTCDYEKVFSCGYLLAGLEFLEGRETNELSLCIDEVRATFFLGQTGSAISPIYLRLPWAKAGALNAFCFPVGVRCLDFSRRRDYTACAIYGCTEMTVALVEVVCFFKPLVYTGRRLRLGALSPGAWTR